MTTVTEARHQALAQAENELRVCARAYGSIGESCLADLKAAARMFVLCEDRAKEMP